MRQVLLVLALCAGACSAPVSGAGRVEVAAAFYPLASVAEAIGGPAVSVTNLTPAGVEPHDLELSPAQIQSLASADLVLYVGGGFQPAVEQAVDGDDAAVDLLAVVDPVTDGEVLDPHAWLDPSRLAVFAAGVGARMKELAPDDAAAIEKRTDELVAGLTALDREYEVSLAGCRSRVLVTSHAAFGYLAERYDLEQIGISGPDPEAEVSAQRMAEVAASVARLGVTTIFVERLLSPRAAETVAREAGVEISLLDPLEGAPEEGDYMDAMRANLQALKDGLGCR